MFTTRTATLPRLAQATLLALLIAGCSGADSTPVTTAAPETRTITQLDAAVRAAAQALLDLGDVDATTVYFDRNDPERIYRYDWMTSRSNGDHIVVSSDLDQMAVAAFIQAGSDRYSASVIDNESQPWSRFGPALSPPQGTIPLLIATEIANGAVSDLAEGPGEIEIIRQAASDGSELWRLTRSPEDDGEVISAFEWVIDRDGLLWFYRSENNEVTIDELVGASIIGFSVTQDPKPIEAPSAGATLNLAELGVPEDLRELAS